MARVSSSVGCSYIVRLTSTDRFIFPSEPEAGIIDLTMNERPFYFNPYSGELSLEFPKAEIKCPGGILA